LLKYHFRNFNKVYLGEKLPKNVRLRKFAFCVAFQCIVNYDA